jgi:hypothetical protein
MTKLQRGLPRCTFYGGCERDEAEALGALQVDVPDFLTFGSLRSNAIKGFARAIEVRVELASRTSGLRTGESPAI